MKLKNYLQTQYNKFDVKGLWIEDFKNSPNVLLNIDEFKNIEVEFVKDIHKEPIDGMIIIKNLPSSNLKSKIRLYSLRLEGEDVYYNISKNSLKSISKF